MENGAKDYRALWRERGELTDCPNQAHTFKIGPFVGQWRIASECWSDLTIAGNMVNHGLTICTINSLDGYRALKVVIWRLSVHVLIRNPATDCVHHRQTK